jgi:hypothetical protein
MTNLTEKFDALAGQLAAQHTAVLARLAALGTKLDALAAPWDAGAGMSAYNLLDSIYLALSGLSGGDSASRALLARLLAQFDTSAIYPTIKDLLLTISAQQAQLTLNTANPLLSSPAGLCAEPFVSQGRVFAPISSLLTEPQTWATWEDVVPSDFSVAYDNIFRANIELHCSEWNSYRVYVASKADYFNYDKIFGGSRLQCNQWHVIPVDETPIIGGARFSVEGDNDLIVYICGGGGPGVCPGYSDPLTCGPWMPTGAEGASIASWAAGSYAGGASWAMDVVVPLYVDNPAFIIPSEQTASLCVSWSGIPDSTYYCILKQYMLVGDAWIAGQGSEALVGTASGTDAGSVTIGVLAGPEYAYIATCSADAGNPPPSGSIRIAHMPVGGS